MFTVLICGSRGWHQAGPIGQTLDELKAEHGEQLLLVHGGAKGADALAHSEAARRGIRTVVERADWDAYGPAAGPIRNQRMLDQHHPDIVHAFRADGRSTGTDDMVARSHKAGVTVYVHTITTESALLS